MRTSSFNSTLSEIYQARLRRATYVVFLVFAVLVLRLWYLQVVHGPEYRVKSENNRIHLRDILPFRGMIFDRNGYLLVDNKPSYSLYLIPEDISDLEPLLKQLEKLAYISPELILSKLKNASGSRPFRPVLIKRDLSREDLAAIETHSFNLPGVVLQVQPQRYYMQGELASHVIGYLGEISHSELRSGRYPDVRLGNLVGKSGVEARWQNHLHGSRGGEQVEVDAAGRQLKVLSKKPAVSGLNLALSLDKDLQAAAEKELKDKKGAIVAIDPATGEVLAMASAPPFNPNQFISGIDTVTWRQMVSGGTHPLQNRSISGVYPPGSIFKIAVALAGLEEGAIDPDEEEFCGGRYQLGGHIFRCWRREGHGKVDYHRAMAESCDVYFYKLGRRLGVDTMAHYSKMLGLGKTTGLELRGERPGLIPTKEWKLKRFGVAWQHGETISTSIGQSFVLVTPIQAARMIAAVFNGGVLHQPKVVRWAGKEDKTEYAFEPTVISKLDADRDNLLRLQRSLIAVVNDSRGTGRRARVEGITVAGKTGTAQVVSLEAEKASEKDGEIPERFRDHAWFVAVAPAENPRIALAVLVENSGLGGGREAAPMAGELIRTYLGEVKNRTSADTEPMP